MPSRNTIKVDAPQSYYHVYARGASKQEIFLDSADYLFFLGLFERHLSIDERRAPWGTYPHLRGSVEMLAYCLMPNHFHLFVYQEEAQTMSKLMRSVMTSYSRYFNHRYKRTGSLFETRYKASRIDTDSYLRHISRYIHLNPRYYRRYPYSSLRYYLGAVSPEWLQIDRISQLFSSAQAYEVFVADYKANRLILDSIKHELADK